MSLSRGGRDMIQKLLCQLVWVVTLAALYGCVSTGGSMSAPAPQSGGLYMSKDKVYCNEVALFAQTAGGFFLSGTADCKDKNDLLLYGGCWSQGGGTRIYQSYPWFPEDSSKQSGWYCTFQTETPLVVGSNAGLVKVCCLRVH